MNNTNIFRYSQYNRTAALSYAHKWAFARNPQYYNFESLGGDCTNFASQVIFSGCCNMNFTPTHGWYYVNSKSRTPSWTGVDFLYKFLIGNNSTGPFAKETDVKDISLGDLIQLSFQNNDHFNHSLIVVKVGNPPSISNIQVCTHTEDRDYYNLSKYTWKYIRFLHIMGSRM